MSNRTLIIAEAGVNHNGDIGIARRLIDLAVEAGADIVKFQTFSADRLVVKSAPKAGYQIKRGDISESQYEMLRRLELSSAAHDELITYCDKCGIEFMSTAFDEQSVIFLAKRGLKRFKVPSGELTNLSYLRCIATVASEVIMSTGMATLDEIGDAIDVFEKAGINRNRLTVLHCTTEYPAPMPSVNLLAMQTIARTYDVNVGYSDHTEGTDVAIAAVALGATVIEKHVTLNRYLPGPDHLASLDPEQFKAMVLSIRNIEIAMGDGTKAPSPGELANRLAIRKSLVALKHIRAGEIFTLENLGAKRPGQGISPMKLDNLLGTTAPRAFCPDDPIEL